MKIDIIRDNGCVQLKIKVLTIWIEINSSKTDFSVKSNNQHIQNKILNTGDDEMLKLCEKSQQNNFSIGVHGVYRLRALALLIQMHQ